jgi:hypothetical protein
MIGFAMTIIGIFMIAADGGGCYYITIKNVQFDCESLGWGLVVVGGILAALMILGNGICWIDAASR